MHILMELSQAVEMGLEEGAINLAKTKTIPQ